MDIGYDIRAARISDNDAIETIIAEAFGEARSNRHINRMRENCTPYEAGGLVAVGDDGGLLGSIRYYMAEADSGEQFPFLGPLAVQPHLRGQGIGKALISESLQNIKSLGHDGVLIVGDSGYYAPFGFTPAVVQTLQLGGEVSPLTFMGLEWQAGAIANSRGSIRFIKDPNAHKGG